MTITIADLGHTQSSSSSQNITTTANIQTGDMVLILTTAGTISMGLSSVANDASGNVYTFPSGQGTGSLSMNYAYTLNAVALSSGATLAITYLGVAGHVCNAYRIAGMRTTSPIIDTNTIENLQATQTTATATARRFNQNSDITFQCLSSTSNDPGTYTPGAGWTNLGGSQASRFLQVAYQITSDQAALTATPTWVNNISSRFTLINGFRGAVSASHSYLGMMGVSS